MNTKDKESNFEPYVFSIKEQAEQHVNSLDTLRDIAQQKTLSFVERSAVERSIQVLVETAIGCSKHLLKKREKPVPSEARASIERVYEILAITEPELNDLRGAIGMRNAIIHDYLNLDWQKLEIVLKSSKYNKVNEYITVVSRALCN